MQITLTQTAELLRKATNLIITAHVNPDGDAIGSSLALMHYLNSLGKNVKLLLDDDIPNNFSMLPGYGMFAKPETAENDIDLLIALDTSTDRIGRVKELVKAPVLNIDHHVSNDKSADYLYLDATRAAAGEIIFELLKEMQAEFTPDIAVCIYTAIATDCGFFRYSNTTSFTMQAGAELLSYGVQPHRISEALEAKPLATVKGITAALNTLELFADEKIAVVQVSKEVIEAYSSTEGLVDHIRIIDGVDVAVVVKYVEDGICRVSMRSKDTDVSKIAMGFHGGGHARAAGCTLNASLSDAKQSVVQAIAAAMEASKNA